MRRAIIAAFALALLFPGLSWVSVEVERDRYRTAIRMGVPPEAEVLAASDEPRASRIGFSRSAEFRLPGPPLPEKWLRRIAERPGYRLRRRSRYEYRFQESGLDRGVTYDPTRRIYHYHDRWNGTG